LRDDLPFSRPGADLKLDIVDVADGTTLSAAQPCVICKSGNGTIAARQVDILINGGPCPAADPEDCQIFQDGGCDVKPGEACLGWKIISLVCQDCARRSYNFQIVHAVLRDLASGDEVAMHVDRDAWLRWGRELDM
jgi:hypothetical protein